MGWNWGEEIMGREGKAPCVQRASATGGRVLVVVVIFGVVVVDLRRAIARCIYHYLNIHPVIFFC